MCKKPLNPNSRTAGRIDSRFFASASSLKIRALWVSFPIIERSEQGKWVNFHFEYVGLGLGLEKGLPWWPLMNGTPFPPILEPHVDYVRVARGER